jgi:uncharacterized glyoxalase superfamily protein PhnB
MNHNRSIPDCVVIPELAYADVGQAVTWLCEAFGFQERLRIANHRAQLTVGAGAVIVMERRSDSQADPHHAVLIRVEDVDRHCQRATAHGATIRRPPTDHPYGERQYTAVDPGGHVWTFSQTIADSDPASWGGVLVANADR